MNEQRLPSRPLIPTAPRPATIAITLVEEDDLISTPPEVDPNSKYAAEDQAFVDSINCGAWHFIGLRAQADILIPYGEDFITAQIKSPGLWGIVAEGADEDYRQEVFEEERATLTAMLESISQAISQPVSQPEKPTPGYPSPLREPAEPLNQFAAHLAAVFGALPHVNDNDWATHDDLWARVVGRCEVCGAGLELESDGSTHCYQTHTDPDNGGAA